MVAPFRGASIPHRGGAFQPSGSAGTTRVRHHSHLSGNPTHDGVGVRTAVLVIAEDLELGG